MKSRVEARHHQRTLCVFPRYAPSLAKFPHACALMDGARALMPPSGNSRRRSVVAARMGGARLRREYPAGHQQGVRPGRCRLGPHIQRGEIRGRARRARAPGNAIALGRRSVSAAREEYAEFDYFHRRCNRYLGPRLTKTRTASWAAPFSFRHKCVPLAGLPSRVDARRYFCGRVQYLSGWPYAQKLRPADRRARSADRCGVGIAVHFVDDSFIGNKKATRIAAASPRLAKTTRLIGCD